MTIKTLIKNYICRKKPNFNCQNGDNLVSTEIPEITPMGAKKSIVVSKRINFLLPSINKEHVFGGISTAINFFQELQARLPAEFCYRVIITDASANDTISTFAAYKVLDMNQDSSEQYQLVFANDRYGKELPIGIHDVFLATAWWTAYNAKELIRMQNYFYSKSSPLVYFVQDFEPGFYQWSSRYSLAESTYKDEIKTIAVINSKELYDFMKIQKYPFAETYYFVPKLNKKLKEFLPKLENTIKTNRILVYGRPGVARNAFEIVVNSLKVFAQYENAKVWEFISLGEQHRDIDLGNGNVLISKGKVSLEEYANYLLTSKIGLSLMISPHPSYPPLEMAYFGLKTITNSYENKNLSYMHENIVNIDDLRPGVIGNKIIELSSFNSSEWKQNNKYDKSYISENEQFGFIDEIIEKSINNGQ
jgi:O-antigen biosynthesis protein